MRSLQPLWLLLTTNGIDGLQVDRVVKKFKVYIMKRATTPNLITKSTHKKKKKTHHDNNDYREIAARMRRADTKIT